MTSVHNPAMTSANPPPSPGYGELLERVSSLEQCVQKLLSEKKRSNSQQHLLHLEQQHETCSSPRLRDVQRVPYPSTFGLSIVSVPSVFQMPLHYPRYTRSDYQAMEEWRLDRLLEEYGLPIPPTLDAKREFAIGTFLWEN
ncbi:hypothetical protein L7F22_035553 [Adiantum nelumboides]|nr:hypothetical protein [Adiantum nelumboides]